MARIALPVFCFGLFSIGSSSCGLSPSPAAGDNRIPVAMNDGGELWNDASVDDAAHDSSEPGIAADAGSRDGGSSTLGSDASMPDAGSVDAGFLDAGAPSEGGQGEESPGTDLEMDAGISPWQMPSRAVCAGRYAIPPVETGALEDPALVETSGLAASIVNPGVLWAHNDSGDGARLFALGTDGRALGQLELENANFIDAEDIAVAACPDLSASCLYLADTGDNSLSASEVALYILPEPLVDPVYGLEVSSTSDYQRVRFQYAGGPVDVEAIAVEPDGSRVYLFEKLHTDSVKIFTLDAPFSEQLVAIANLATSFSPPGIAFVNHGRSITAADLHLSGTRLLVRVYSGIYEYRFGEDQTVLDLPTLEPALVTLGPLSEPQGEALTYDETGRQIFSVSEDTGQLPGQPLHLIACQ